MSEVHAGSHDTALGEATDERCSQIVSEVLAMAACSQELALAKSLSIVDLTDLLRYIELSYQVSGSDCDVLKALAITVVFARKTIDGAAYGSIGGETFEESAANLEESLEIIVDSLELLDFLGEETETKLERVLMQFEDIAVYLYPNSSVREILEEAIVGIISAYDTLCSYAHSSLGLSRHVLGRAAQRIERRAEEAIAA